MTDPMSIALTGLSVLAVTALAAHAGLRAFTNWMEYKRAELDNKIDADLAPAGGMIEIADLRERVRKLEAIAAGIDP
ncbi:light-harvesting protein [Sphingomicrobium sediminis]|uniref:Light-harvesting protein n=1 Tax=Sphingomicrobium sediminis TaxID=2950949 RepID=A0A9X2J1R0_9SPHN|nr:light-harvesting protein [Sphingomicrobium sediminis]MCM8556240.1 light-harvesting protein [Sphingomicrobium sediminis]